MADIRKQLKEVVDGMVREKRAIESEERKESDAVKLALLMEGVGKIEEIGNNIVESNQKTIEALNAFRIEIPPVVVPDIKIPEINVPEVKMPQITIPEIKIPTINVPKIELPTINVPEPKVTVNVPDFPKIPAPIVNIPDEMMVRGNVGITNSVDDPIPTRIVDKDGKDVSLGGVISGGGGARIDKVSLLNSEQQKINPATSDKQPSLTRFNESLIAQKNSQFNFKPTWGITTLRYTATNSGTGATSGETGGEFRLQSGTANNGLATIQTNQRGQYKAGAMGQAGIGVRVPTLPTSTAFCEWGYTDFTNGFYFGVDGTGKYVAYVTGGTVTKTYQSDWNVDKLDGTGGSGYTLDLANGNISQIEFTWYGYGDIEYSYYIGNPNTRKIEKVVCHRTRIDDSASVIDPNQPLTFRTGNGASTTTNVSLYIGGHQFSTVDGILEPQRRQGGEILSNYTTVADTNWQPIIAIRKKAQLNGRANSVLAYFNGFSVTSDSDMEIRVTVGGTTSNGTWGTPTAWTSTETAMETKVTVAGAALTTSASGNPVDYSFVLASGTGLSRGGQSTSFNQIPLGATNEIILWVRRLSATGTMIIKNASVTWEEEW